MKLISFYTVGTPYEQEAEKLLTGIQASIGSNENLDANTGLDYAKTLFKVGHDNEAKTLLASLAERFANDANILQKIESLLDEPVGFRQKLQARTLNRDGIKAFESGDLAAASEAFSRALSVVPEHAALNLNLVQVLLKEFEADPKNRDLLKQCEDRLNRLEDLPEQHRQHRRYTALRRKVEGMQHD